MTRFGKGNHNIMEQVNRKYKHGTGTETSRLPHQSRARKHETGMEKTGLKLGRKRGKILVGA